MDLRELSQQDLANVQQEMAEIRLLIRQMEGEVERAAQRSQEMAERVRLAEASVASPARNELQEAYAAAGEAQMRLLTMQTQKEQLQGKEALLQRCQQYLQRALDLADSGKTPSAPPTPPPDTSSIARIIQAEEDERYRLARQIHDGPAQSLTNVVLRADICRRLIDRDPARARAELAELQEVVRATLQETRRFIFDVRPMILDDLGLLPTLRRYVEAFGEKNALKVELSALGQGGAWPTYVEIAVFRVIQEAVENAARHAQASRVQVKVNAQADRLVAIVEDDGQGFVVADVVRAAPEQRTLGLAGMRERAAAIGGRLTIDSAPGQGTRVQLEVPLA